MVTLYTSIVFLHQKDLQLADCVELGHVIEAIALGVRKTATSVAYILWVRMDRHWKTQILSLQ